MTNTTPAPITLISVSDLTLRVDGRVGTYKLGDKTYTVLRPGYGMTVAELARGARYESDLTPWIEQDAYDAGIRLTF